MELIPTPLVGGALSLDGIRGSCVPEGSLGSLFTERRSVIPPGLLFALGLLSGWLTGGARFSQSGYLQRKALLLNIPESFASNVLPSQQATFTPVFPGCLPRTAGRFDPNSEGDLTLP